MKQKNPIYFHMSCGCKLYQKDLKNYKHLPVCPDHNGLIVRRSRNCCDCGKEFPIKLKYGGRKLRCDKCHDINRIESSRKASKKSNDKIKSDLDKLRLLNPVKKKPVKLKPVEMSPVKKYINPIPEKMRPFIKSFRGDYCRKLPLCMKLHKTLPCLGCLNYVGIFKGVDPGKVVYKISS